jgi:hypothetical protein
MLLRNKRKNTVISLCIEGCITHLLAHVEICRYLCLEPIPGTKQTKSQHKMEIFTNLTYKI